MKAILGAVFVDSESFEDTWNVSFAVRRQFQAQFQMDCFVLSGCPTHHGTGDKYVQGGMQSVTN